MAVHGWPVITSKAQQRPLTRLPPSATSSSTVHSHRGCCQRIIPSQPSALRSRCVHPRTISRGADPRNLTSLPVSCHTMPSTQEAPDPESICSVPPLPRGLRGVCTWQSASILLGYEHARCIESRPLHRIRAGLYSRHMAVSTALPISLRVLSQAFVDTSRKSRLCRCWPSCRTLITSRTRPILDGHTKVRTHKAGLTSTRRTAARWTTTLRQVCHLMHLCLLGS